MYDTIIIGRDISSLIAALSASGQGLHTLLVTEGNQELEYRDAGYTFPIDPTPFSGIGHGQTVSRLLEGLRLSSANPPKMLQIDPAFQVILPGQRIEVYRDQRRFRDELLREFPSREREIRRLYRVVARGGERIGGWIDGESAGRHDTLKGKFRHLLRLLNAAAASSAIARYGSRNDGALARIIEAQIAFLSHLALDGDLFPLVSAYLLAIPAKGIYYPLGGRKAWMNWLRNEYIASGGELLDGCSVMRIETKPEIIIDVEHTGASSTLHGTTLIVSTNWEKLNLLLVHQKAFRKVTRSLDLNRPAGYPFCLHLGIRQDATPEKMAPYAAVVPDDTRPLCRQNVVFLAQSLPGEQDRAPEGKRALSATILLPESPLVVDDSRLKDTAKTIIDSLDSFLPFLRESIDYVNMEKSIAFARQSQEVINQKYRRRKYSLLGVDVLSPATPLRNVFLTGGMLRAGLGFEGEILAGIDTAARAAKFSKKMLAFR